MRGCLNALTFVVILAIAGFSVLAIVGWLRDGGSTAADKADQAGRLLKAPVAVEVLEVF